MLAGGNVRWAACNDTNAEAATFHAQGGFEISAARDVIVTAGQNTRSTRAKLGAN